MPPKPKRQPHPVQQHLKHSRQLLEDFLFQFLPHITGLGAVSRLNLYTWFSGRWGSSPDARGGVPFMVLEALRLQRHSLLSRKLPLKPLSFTLLGTAEDNLLPKALPLLQELNSQSHTARIDISLLPAQELLKHLQLLLQRQPASERNLLLLDPLDLRLPPLEVLLPMLPKRMDVLLILPLAAIRWAGGIANKSPLHEAVLKIAEESLAPLLKPQQETEQEEKSIPILLKQLREQLSVSSDRYTMHYLPAVDSPVVLYGLTPDALMMERMLLCRHKLEQLTLAQTQAGDQLGLFSTQQSDTLNQAPQEANLLYKEHIEELLSQQAEWNNQDLYHALLQQELLPQKAVPALLALINAGKLEVLDEKRKKLKVPGPLPINQTASKLPAPSRYFRLLP